MGQIYKYSGTNGTTMGSMSDAEILDVMLKAEKSLRSGVGTYSDAEIFPAQIEEMKAWPEDVKAFTRDVAKEIKAAHPEYGKARLQREAMASTLTKMIVPKRALGKDKVAHSAEMKVAAADLALSMLFKKAPDVSEDYKPRKMLATKEYTFLVKPSTRITKLVVNVADIHQADVYVLALYNEQLNKAWLLAYATKKDLLAAKKGDRITNPEECPWNKMSYYLEPSQLKPISGLIKNLGLTDLPVGVLMETMPSAEAIPLPSKINENLMTPTVDDGTDFDELLGLVSTKKTAAAKVAAPTKVETVPDIIIPETTPKPAKAEEQPKEEPKQEEAVADGDFAF